MKDQPHDILGIPPDADKKAIQKAYRALVKEHHPDLGGDPAKFKMIHDAYLAMMGGSTAELSHTDRREKMMAAILKAVSKLIRAMVEADADAGANDFREHLLNELKDEKRKVKEERIRLEKIVSMAMEIRSRLETDKTENLLLGGIADDMASVVRMKLHPIKEEEVTFSEAIALVSKTDYRMDVQKATVSTLQELLGIKSVKKRPHPGVSSDPFG